MERFKTLAIVLLTSATLGLNLSLPAWHDAHLGVVEGRTQTDLLLDVLGEVRTFMAKMVWLEVDVYHHAMSLQGMPFQEERDVLPLLKLVILLDPTFEEAYDTAAFHLVFHFNRADEGIALLDEGLRHRPRSPLLSLARAMYLLRLRRYGEALDAGLRAYPLCAEDEFQRLNALRIIAHSAFAAGQPGLARQACAAWLEMRPGDPVVMRLLNEHRAQ